LLFDAPDRYQGRRSTGLAHEGRSARQGAIDRSPDQGGRRTAITRWARKISSVGGSMRDVQALARHSSLALTQRYIEVSEDAMRKVVG
jgi:integrase/recombinase XerD